MFTAKADRPYFEVWLKRTRRQFAVSGRLSQTALLLARHEGGTPAGWATRLREILDGGEVPSLDVLTQIDKHLAGVRPGAAPEDTQGSLW